MVYETAPDGQPEIEHAIYLYLSDEPGKITWKRLREITVVDFETVSRALTDIQRFVTSQHNRLSLAESDLRDEVSQLELQFTDLDRMRHAELWLPRLELRVIHLSAGLRMYEEYALARAARLWGKKDHKYEEVQALFSRVYDASQAYRFVYYLRNALVHGSTNMLRVEAKAQLDPVTEARTAAVTLLLIRNAFSSGNLKAAIRNEASSLPADPDVLGLCFEAVEAIAAVDTELHRLLNPDLDAAVEVIWPYMVEAQKAGGGAPHFHRHKRGDPFAKLSVLGMSRTIYELVLAETRRRTAGVGDS